MLFCNSFADSSKMSWDSMAIKAVKISVLIEASWLQSLTADPQVHDQGNSCEICGFLCGTSTDFC